MKITKTILIYLLFPVLIWFITTRFADKAELKFTLSQPMPTSASEQLKKEYLQELLVKNVGKDEAKKISINFKGSKFTYDIKKNSESDTVKEIYNNNDGVELLYDSLPPSGDIKLIIKSAFGLPNNMLLIQHSKGKATDALSNNKIGSIIFNNLSGIIYTFFFFVILAYQFYEGSKESDSRYKPELTLSMNKPLLLSDKKWRDIRDEAIKHSFENYRINNVDDIRASFCYRYLSKNSNAIISSDESDKFLTNCINALKESINKIAIRAYKLKDIEDLIRLPKPTLVTDNKWEDTLNYLINCYIEKYLHNLYLERIMSLNDKDISKPDFISDSKWADTRWSEHI